MSRGRFLERARGSEEVTLTLSLKDRVIIPRGGNCRCSEREKGGTALWVPRGRLGGGGRGAGVPGPGRAGGCGQWSRLTGQDEVQELESRPEAGAGDVALVGVQGQEDQAAEQGQEAGPHGEAAGRVVAVEDTAELRRVRLVLVAIGQQGGEDDEGEDLRRREQVPGPRVELSLPPNPFVPLGPPSVDQTLLSTRGQLWPLPPVQSSEPPSPVPAVAPQPPSHPSWGLLSPGPSPQPL